MTRLAALFLLIVSCSASKAADCTNLTPVQCYSDGLKQVEEALGKFKTLEADLKQTQKELAEAKQAINALKQAVIGLTSRVSGLESKTAGISGDGNSLTLTAAKVIFFSIGDARYDFPSNGNLNIRLRLDQDKFCFAANDKARAPDQKCF